MTAESSSDLEDYALGLCDRELKGYRIKPERVEQDHNIEIEVLAGGYAYRQVFELIQNGADAIADAAEVEGSGSTNGRIAVWLRGGALYVANTGMPLTREGILALQQSHTSRKRTICWRPPRSAGIST